MLIFSLLVHWPETVTALYRDATPSTVRICRHFADQFPTRADIRHKMRDMDYCNGVFLVTKRHGLVDYKICVYNLKSASRKRVKVRVLSWAPAFSGTAIRYSMISATLFKSICLPVDTHFHTHQVRVHYPASKSSSVTINCSAAPGIRWV